MVAAGLAVSPRLMSPLLQRPVDTKGSTDKLEDDSVETGDEAEIRQTATGALSDDLSRFGFPLHGYINIYTLIIQQSCVYAQSTQ